MGLPLPDELISLTFSHLDAPSILRCMQVCKLFHSIISECTQLNYKIELFASYMEDNEHLTMDTVTRLDRLREYNQAWNDMSWASSGFIPRRNGNCWEFSGGILAQSTRENEIFFDRLPCKLKDVAEERWSVPFDFRIRDFTFDNSQNLLVLLELVENAPDVSCKIYFRTLTGEQHPRAAVAQITRLMENVNHVQFSFLIQICGGHLAIFFCDEHLPPSQNFFVVWNWQTGHQEIYIRTQAFQSFAFMTEDHVLAAVLRSEREPTLRVLNISAFANLNAVYSVEDMPYLCELQYPAIMAYAEYFLIRSEPTPTWRPPAELGVPFYRSPRDFIFTVSMHNLLGDIHGSTVLLVPLSVLLSEVERSRGVPCRNVAWSEWGPKGTRMICRKPSETWVCYTYGMKFIHGLRWRNGHVARVYDFNAYAASKHVKATVDSPVLWKRLAPFSEPSARCNIFEEAVITTLPGRVITTTLRQWERGWDAVMIGEDHIVMVQPSSGKYGYMAM